MARSAARETVSTGRPPPIALRPDDDLDDDALDADESPMRDGRNENSLAYLCQRFCDMYQNHSEPINIDHAAKELGIQRRRMYEILNIIQSVGLVGRLRASFYRWDGYDKMAVVLERLKEEGMARLAQASRASAPSSAAGNPGCLSPEGQRRKAVATALGERFVQIFLCNEVPQPVILEDIMGLFASCVGSASALTNQTSCARRLYDIANVFCSIGLVRKSCAPATDNRRKKRLYDWIGPVPTATATPLRPARLALVAPSASPGSGSAKRVKRESGVDTPRASQLRKKSRLSTGNLEASIRKADEDAALEPKKVLAHPAVAALRGATGDKSRAMLVARSLDTSTSASALSSLASASAKLSSSLFNPPNAKDGSLSPFTARGGAAASKLSAPPQLVSSLAPASSSTVLSSSSSSTSTSSKPASASPNSSVTSKCSCGSSTSSESPAALKAQVEQLQKELHDAKQREQELRRRLDAQEAQIKSLSRSATSSSPATFLLNAGSSPLTNLAFSPFQGSLARDAFASLSGSPSPYQSGSGNFFSPGSASRSGRPPFTRKVVRLGPNIVDPADGDDLLPAASPHLSPGTTSIASSLLLSPMAATPSSAASNKENRLAIADRRGKQNPLLSPPRITAIKTEAGVAPSTPPHCNLIATAASSLLSLTPSQIPSFSPSIHRMFANDLSDSDSEPEAPHDDDLSTITVKQETAEGSSSASNQDDNDAHDASRANAASPEPCAVRTPASLAAPSSPSPSAKGVKTLVRHLPPSKSPLAAVAALSATAASSSPSSPSVSTTSASSSALAVSLAAPRVADCLS